MPTQDITVNGTTFTISINENDQAAPATPTPAYTLAASGSAINDSAAGVNFGTVTTNLDSATVSLTTQAGQAVAIAPISGAFQLSAGARKADIMYRRSLNFEAQAVKAETSGSPGVTLKRAVQLAIVEAGAPSLTVTRAGGTLTCKEFNAPLTPLDVITASGGTGPYRFSVITDGSPMEVASLSANTAQLYMTGWMDTTVNTAPVVARVRAQDSTGAYGYLDVSVTITPFALSDIADLIVFDAANATTSAGVVTGLNASQGTTNFALKVPTGTATPPVTDTVLCPDGVTRPILVHNDTVNPGLVASAGVAGSSTTLAPLFSQTNIRAPKFTIIAACKPETDAFTDIMAVHAATVSGSGWAANVNQGVAFGMNASSQLVSRFGTDSAAYYGVATAAKQSAGWQLATAYGEGVSAYIEPDNPEWYPYTAAYSPDYAQGGSNQVSDPSHQLETASLTCDTLQIGGGFAPTGKFSWAIMVAVPRCMTRHEKQQVWAYLARHYPVTYTPPARKVTSGMEQTFGATPALGGSDFSSFLWGDTWSWEFDSYAAGQPINVLNPGTERAFYPNERYPAITATYPEKGAFYDASKGALMVRSQPNTAAQQAFVHAHAGPFGVDDTLFTWRATGVRTTYTFSQYLGYFETKVKNPRGRGLWSCSWTFPDAGGSFEMDFGETNCQTPGFSSCTLHSEDNGMRGGPGPNLGAGIRTDDHTANWTLWGADWSDNGDGTHTIQFYCNREKVGLPIVEVAGACNRVVSLLLDLTMGGGGATPTTYTTSDAPHFFQVAYYRVYRYVDSDRTQPPLALTRPTLSGTRANGNVITATPGTFDWSGSSDYKWFTFDWTNGEVALSGQTAVTLTDATANLSKTLIFEHGETGTEWANRIHQRAYMDPTTTPNLTLLDASLAATTTLPAYTAVGAHLAFISPAVLGAAVTITASDVTGYFTVSADGRELLAGPNYASAPASATVHLTQTPRFGGPVNDQAIAVTVTGGAGGSGGAWAPTTGWTLTNSNLTADLSPGGADKTILGTHTINHTTGDYSFTVHVDAFGSGNQLSIGVADSSFTNDHNLGTGSHSAGVYSSGTVVYNGFTTGGSFAAFAAGDTVTVRVKNGNLYFSKDGGSTWIGSTSSANPATDTGGVPLSFLASDCVPVVYAFTGGTQVTGTF